MPFEKDTFFANNNQRIIKKVKPEDTLINLNLEFSGYNEDIIQPYYWHINFAYYTGKGYKPLKLEDLHYFSEANQYGAQFRQMKGGSIRAFQESMTQFIVLIKQHLMPLLDEVKKSEFYFMWLMKIVDNDKIIRDELSKSNSDENILKSARNERNEAINHIKDKWASEVDGGRIWTMSSSAAERGLDFTLLPQLFFGINLDDPFQVKKTLKEQLDDDIYPITISLTAKEAVARTMYRFYTWLPTAIKETQTTFKIKIAALKNIYAQVETSIKFMKPLLKEINKKSEGLENGNFYKAFDEENAEFINMFDYSYSFTKLLGIRNFAKESRGDWEITDLEFTRYGLYLRTGKEIINGPMKGKKGYIIDLEVDSKGNNTGYYFIQSDKLFKSDNEFKNALDKKILISIDDLKKFPIMEFDFSQRRRNDTVQTPQGLQQVPYMTNKIIYNGYAWNIVEIAVYRKKIKDDDFELIANLIGEIAVVKDELIKYAHYLEGDIEEIFESIKQENKEKSVKKSSNDLGFILDPFRGLGQAFFPLIPYFPNLFKKSDERLASKKLDKDLEKQHNSVRVSIIEDTWKVYTIHKRASVGLMQY